MRDFAILLVHLIVTLARLTRPGGLRSVVAESVLVRHQLLILSRGRKRAPHLRVTDRIIAGLCTLFIRKPDLIEILWLQTWPEPRVTERYVARNRLLT